MALTYIGTSQAVIDSPGDYVIDRDLTQPNPNQDCVIINPGVHYVTLHLRSRLVGAGGSASTNAGIKTNGSAACTILNEGGSIRGFGYGVQMSDSYLARIIGVFVQDAWFRGIKLSGDAAYIADCDIRNITGATWTPNAYCFGIEVSGMSTNGSPKVLRNLVENVLGMGESGESVGISFSDNGLGGLVVGNIIKNPTLRPRSWGVWVGGQSDVTASHNLIDTWENGAGFSSPTDGFIDENAIVNCTNLIINSGSAIIGGMDG